MSHQHSNLSEVVSNPEMSAEDLVSELPAELQERIFSCLPPDLQTLCVKGHILVMESRAVSLPPGTLVRLFAVGAGGTGRVSFTAK